MESLATAATVTVTESPAAEMDTESLATAATVMESPAAEMDMESLATAATVTVGVMESPAAEKDMESLAQPAAVMEMPTSEVDSFAATESMLNVGFSIIGSLSESLPFSSSELLEIANSEPVDVQFQNDENDENDILHRQSPPPRAGGSAGNSGFVCSTPAADQRAQSEEDTEEEDAEEEDDEEELRFQLDKLKVSLVDFTRMSHVADDEVAEFDPKSFWQSYKPAASRFNCMYELSQLFMAIPQSTMNLERDFHALAMTLTCLRTRLSDETLNDLLLVKQNFGFLKEHLLRSNKYDLLKPLRVSKATIAKRNANEMENSGDEEAVDIAPN